MVATIRASCPDCGDVELTPAQLQVLMCADTSDASYAFRCPECRLMVAKPTEPRVVDVLVTSGVALRVWQLPAELDEVRQGPPLNWDDLLEFHFLLGQSDWFDRATSDMGPGEPA